MSGVKTTFLRSGLGSGGVGSEQDSDSESCPEHVHLLFLPSLYSFLLLFAHTRIL